MGRYSIRLFGRQHAYRQQARRRGVLGDRRRDVRDPAPRGGAAERVQPVPLGGSLVGPVGRPAVRRLCPDAVRRRADHQDHRPATVGKITGPDGRDAPERPGSRAEPARLVHLQGHRGDEALYGRDHVRPGRPEHPQALELLLLADQGRRDPRALGRRQRPGRHHAARQRRHPWSPPPAATSRPARTSSAPARTACSKPPSPPATTPPGSPTSTTTSPSEGPTARSTRPPPRCSSTTRSSAPRRGTGRRPTARTRTSQRWPGHCLGGAVASILLNEPIPAPGSGHDQGRAQGALGRAGREPPTTTGSATTPTRSPPAPPAPASTPATRFVPRFHQMLETHIRGRTQALLGNLRAFPPRGTATRSGTTASASTPPRTTPIPGKGDRAVRLEVELEANSGSSPQRPGRQAAGRQLRVHPRLRPRRQGR